LIARHFCLADLALREDLRLLRFTLALGADLGDVRRLLRLAHRNLLALRQLGEAPVAVDLEL
jgi:hypothetical protein